MVYIAFFMICSCAFMKSAQLVNHWIMNHFLKKCLIVRNFSEKNSNTLEKKVVIYLVYDQIVLMKLIRMGPTI